MEQQKKRVKLLEEMLKNFDDGRSKSYYCITAAVLEIGELERTLGVAEKNSAELGIKEKAGVLHSILDEIARKKKYCLKLRK